MRIFVAVCILANFLTKSWFVAVTVFQAAKEFESEVKGDSDQAQENGGNSEEREKTETITPTPVATPSKTENKSS